MFVSLYVSLVSMYILLAVKLLFSDVSSARSAIKDLNGLKYNNFRVAASFGHPDSLLFVGNLPLTYCKQKLMDLFAPYGKIIRCFIVYSVLSGKSKGYGFVEYSTREEAILAKQKTATKVVGLRSLRVDFADNGMQTCEDLQSKTLFVDKLPKGMQDDTKLRDMFAEYGTVNFCQVIAWIDLPNPFTQYVCIYSLCTLLSHSLSLSLFTRLL